MILHENDRFADQRDHAPAPFSEAGGPGILLQPGDWVLRTCPGGVPFKEVANALIFRKGLDPGQCFVDFGFELDALAQKRPGRLDHHKQETKRDLQRGHAGKNREDNRKKKMTKTTDLTAEVGQSE